MMRTTIADALGRVAARADDALHATVSGAVAEHADVAAQRAPIRSSDPLSVVAPPDAYFVVRRANGERALTRDGGFAIVDGTLRTAGGAAVLGYPGGIAEGAVPAPLRVDPTDRALGRGADARIDTEGRVTFTRTTVDPRTRERTDELVVIGRIALARLPAGTQPQRIDATHIIPPARVEPLLGVPSAGAFGNLTTGARDGGGIDLDAALIRLAEAYEHVSALHAAQRVRGNADRAALDLVK